MINDPSGVVSLNGINLIGHVGWAFLVNRDSGSWYYGANEGPVTLPYVSLSKIWATDGTWADLLKAFSGEYGTASDPTYYHKAGLYTTYRCESIPLNDSSYAQSVVSGELSSPGDYSPPDNDCLSNAVDVL